MSRRPSLPEQARHEAASRLVGLGLYHEAQSLLSIDETPDAELGMLSALLAGDPRAAAKFLGRRMMAKNARTGEVDLIRGCIALVSGHAEALESTRSVLERMEPKSRDWTAFAVSAAPHDLRGAAEAAASVPDYLAHTVLAVRAAALAAEGRADEAQNLLEAARGNDVGDDPHRRAIDLLKLHGHDSAGQALEAAKFNRRPLGESLARHMDSWRRRRSERDLRCRCATTPELVGEISRYYVNWHLELLEHLTPADQGDASWRILFCARSGVRYLDRASIPVSVRIGAFSEPLEAESVEAIG
ncbi:hypothetical protein [Kineosporia babensis]|uniref:Uncharacterized protein n=1 Tax=Kineosporia babensis TaxID=499548 RepID=A0A9X1NGB2_9ACTN|nr:hypothetical protein [Kineosporia babensis]MCD5313583.1 hypothetical protein [Kineosporia babensis]